MSKQNKGLVPELRFPEFRNDESWKALTLSELSTRITEKVGTKKLTTVSITAGLGFVSQAEKFSRDISGKQYKNYIHLRKGEYSYNKGNSKTFPQGCIYKLQEFDEAAAPNAFISFRFKKNHVGDFFRGYFDSNYHGRQLTRFITSGARSDGLLNISPSDFFSIAFPTPTSNSEQQKIADCLASIDELIMLHTQKLDALKDYKKGLMQQLFPAEGETVPKLRFPEFKGDWVEVMLGQAAKYENGKAHEQDIDARGQYIVVNSKFISTAGEIRKFSNSANLLAEKDDILMVLSDVPNGRAIAKCFYVDKDEKYTVNQRVCKLTAKKGYVSKLLYYVIDKNSYFLEFDDGVKQTNLKKDDVLNCPLWVSNDIKEQKKIVGLLDSIDDSIFHQERKLLSLKSHKAGLLQKLFPVMDDVVS